jgi:integrase
MNSAVIFETLKRRTHGFFRAVPVPDELMDILCSLKEGKDPTERLWKFSRPTAYRMVKAKMRLAQIEGGMASPKGLRHGHGVACVAVKIPLTTIQKWLGHARIETTAIYLDVLGEEERMLARRLW